MAIIYKFGCATNVQKKSISLLIKTVQRKRMLELHGLAQNLIKKKTVQIDQLMHLHVCHSFSQDRSSYTLIVVNIPSASASG